jgi:hypothetical protein
MSSGGRWKSKSATVKLDARAGDFALAEPAEPMDEAEDGDVDIDGQA